jgi:F-type H+-transporting ATPase subunit b
MLKRLIQRIAPALMVLVVIAMATTVFAAEEAHKDVIPPLSGEGAGQTYAQAVWVMIIFVILLAILYPTAWKNVLAGLKKREDKIRGDIIAAEAARAKAELSLQEYTAQLTAAEQKAREMIGAATTDAERIAANIRLQAQQESEVIKEKATKDIDAARRQALQEIYAQAAELSTGIAAKILRRNLNADDQRDLVNQSLEQLQNA